MRTNWGARENQYTPELLPDYEPSVGAVAKALIALGVGCLGFYMAMFLYEDEEGQWQNRLDTFGYQLMIGLKQRVIAAAEGVHIDTPELAKVRYQTPDVSHFCTKA